MENEKMIPEVALVACDDYDEKKVLAAVREAIEAVDGFAFVRPGMKVAIKTNLVAAMTPKHAATTHPAVLSAVARLLIERGCEVVIGDSPGGLYTAAAVGHCYRVSGLTACEAVGAKLNDDFSEAEADFPAGVSARHFTYTGYLQNVDAIVDVCKLKTHGMMGLSCAAKNLFGTIPGTVKPEYHFRYPTYDAFADMIVDLNEYFKPTLAVCDAVVGMEGNGPTAGTPRAIGAILASPSTHKLDLVAADLIGLSPNMVPTLLAARRRDLIPETVAGLALAGDPAAFRVSDYKNVAVPHDLQFGGTSKNVIASIFSRVAGAALTAKPKLRTKECVGCNQCGRICPASAITIVKGKAQIDRKKCIRCFCCQEFCPKGAMKVHRPWIARVLSPGAKKNPSEAKK